MTSSQTCMPKSRNKDIINKVRRHWVVQGILRSLLEMSEPKREREREREKKREKGGKRETQREREKEKN